MSKEAKMSDVFFPENDREYYAWIEKNRDTGVVLGWDKKTWAVLHFASCASIANKTEGKHRISKLTRKACSTDPVAIRDWAKANRDVIAIDLEYCSVCRNSGKTEWDLVSNQFRKDVEKALKDSPKARSQRLATANKEPRTTMVFSKVFVRNPDVVAETLIRANGHCEECGKPAPFKRRTDNSPYLEVHHRTPLAQDGMDDLENTLALCPNCHRKAHYG